MRECIAHYVVMTRGQAVKSGKDADMARDAVKALLSVQIAHQSEADGAGSVAAPATLVSPLRFPSPLSSALARG